jgi:hypothetical protein
LTGKWAFGEKNNDFGYIEPYTKFGKNATPERHFLGTNRIV